MVGRRRRGQLQKALGYRFVLDDVSYSSSVGDDDELKIELRCGISARLRSIIAGRWKRRSWIHVISTWSGRKRLAGSIYVNGSQAAVGPRQFSPLVGSNPGEPARATWPDSGAVGGANRLLSIAYKGVQAAPSERPISARPRNLGPGRNGSISLFRTTQYLKGGRHPVGWWDSAASAGASSRKPFASMTSFPIEHFTTSKPSGKIGHAAHVEHSKGAFALKCWRAHS